MRNELKRLCRELICGDSGIAMAYTIIVFLVFFMISLSTFAMSENIRRKMELQNACDAAAYSGAVVQADMLSRIAVLNRALSWTYTETNKRQMDETVANWLNNACRQFRDTEASVRMQAPAYSGGCLCPAKSGIGNNGSSCRDGMGGDMYYWLTGVVYSGTAVNGVRPMASSGELPFRNYYTGRDANPKAIRLNRSQDVPVSTIENRLRGYTSQVTEINTGLTNIKILNEEIEYTRQKLNNAIRSAVATSFNSFGLERTNYTCLLENIQYLDRNWDYGSTGDEDRFLSYSGKSRAGDFANGCDVWWRLQVGDGFSRNYEQAENSLRAAFAWVICGHEDSPHDPCEHHFATGGVSADITGSQTTAAVAMPLKMNSRFFGKNGTIVVAAHTQLVNPFSVIWGNDNIDARGNKDGMYGAWNTTASQRMTAVSAARAGLRLRGDPQGYYRVNWPGETVNNTQSNYNSRGVWNLCEEDWDAVMLPVARAWCTAPQGTTFNNYSDDEAYSTNAVLEAAYEALDSSYNPPADVNGYMWH